MSDTPRSYKVAEKIQRLIENSNGVRLHATDIWQQVLKEEFEQLEGELNEAKEYAKQLLDTSLKATGELQSRLKIATEALESIYHLDFEYLPETSKVLAKETASAALNQIAKQ
jgi:hypothetical protein